MRSLLAMLLFPLTLLAAEPVVVVGKDEKPPVIKLPVEKPTEIKAYNKTKLLSSLQHVVQSKAPEAWAINPAARGKKIRVGVLDTGCQVDHPAVQKNIVAMYNAITKTTDVKDEHGHGTHCTGIVVSICPDVEIVVVKVLGDDGSGGVDNIAHGVDWAVTEGKCDVLSMSLGGPSPDRWLPPAIKRARDAGVVVIAAAGNDGPGDTEGYPGRYPGVISVAAADFQNRLAAFSSHGPNVATVDYGVDIESALPGNRQGKMSGTSMACPIAAAKCAAWIASTNAPKNAARPDDYRKEMIAVSPFSTRNNARGHGLFTVDKLIKPATGQPVPPKPGVPVSVTIGFNDLSKAKQDELAAAGVTKFKLEIGHEGFTSQPSVKAQTGYDAALQAVESGQRITLGVGVPGEQFFTPSLNGIAPGVYECWRENGRNIMLPRRPMLLQLPLCPSGACPR